MTSFDEFLQSRLAEGGFTTEDTLASCLPLLRQVVAAHDAGEVAPLEGLADLQVDSGRIWFEESKLQSPTYNQAALRKLSRRDTSAVEIVHEARVESAGDENHDRIVNLQIGKRDAEIQRPVYLQGYVSWEHLIDHHDPLTDVFSLGLILASIACGLNLNEDDEFAAFVEQRGNLFAIQSGLHPVLARAILRMTELDRHRRPQNLPALLNALENYRDQDIDFDVELARVADFGKQDLHGKQQIVLSKLQERLLDISRRNRLLHFRATMHTVNLTHASVPLSFDVERIRSDQILVWNKDFQKRIASGKGLSLNKHLNFHEALYLPSLLDHIRLDAQRDKNEYGFAQLRLVACFLRWSNLKETPPVEYESPLVLVPVKLTKKKGVRDTFHLKSLDSAAEINPVVRHLFQQLYDIELPERIDLENSSLDDLHTFLAREIEASEPAVSLQKIDRPRIDLIHDKAQRRLDQYRRRVRLAGRSVRRFLDLDYSYDPANYHPLGLQLYNDRIRPAPTRLEVIIDESSVRRNYAAPPQSPPATEKRKTLFSLREGGEGNPYAWEFDLCSVTLGNFKYRKMSLVRDYRALLQENPLNPSFDATFSLSPRPVEDDETAPLELPERYHVVPCDPTQGAAIAESRSGSSYIIQGPPGTGKSQTITNLIADYVARGERVLFVCEKRAAIDVVYHRLRQKGLDRLSCLIHDSQADKKEFVMDLKRTYEEFLADPTGKTANVERKRQQILKQIKRELAPLEEVQSTMTTRPPAVGTEIRELLERLIELKQQLPEFSSRSRESIPDFAHVYTAREELQQVDQLLRIVQPHGVLARYPLRLINDAVLNADRPIEYVSQCLPPVIDSLQKIVRAIAETGLPATSCDTCTKSLDIIRCASQAGFLARQNASALLQEGSQVASDFAKGKRRFNKLRRKLEKQRETAAHWKLKLPANEVSTVLQRARLFEGDHLRFFKPGWWKLRSVLNRCYDFKSHVMSPTYVQVLEWLEGEYAAEQAVHEANAQLAKEFRVEGSFTEFVERISQFSQFVESQPEHVQTAHQFLIDADDADTRIAMLADLAPAAERLPDQLDRFLTDYEMVLPSDLLSVLNEFENALDDLPDYLECARELVRLPREIATALRANNWTVEELEAASALCSFEDVLRKERSFAKFGGSLQARHVQQLDRLMTDWQQINARVLCDRVRARFLEHTKISTLPAAQLTPEQKPFKKEYARGRRELEHEFGKSMRYKPIRELVAGESGMVVKDLKPIWLMSPLSVSDTLPLDTDHFNVVIFDEASQILLEEAVPSLFRATQAIVVGDEMQLPPTNFFSARNSDDNEQLTFEEDGETVEYDLESNSFLNHAARNLPSRMLRWHYRSRSESLISFSNWAFYGGRLLTVPEEELSPLGRQELIAASPEDGVANAAELLKRPVSFHFMQHGVYQGRRNRAEAEYIAELVRTLLQSAAHPTIGVVAFSEAQQGEIEAALDRLAEEDRTFREHYESELEREEDDQFAGLLVKNLENIQGDERDVIIMSVCYAPNESGKMRMNFGPINQSGGKKRLNVAFSRAKHHMALVSSIRFSAITNDYNDGANCLKNYLQYAERSSSGDAAGAQRVLQMMSLARTGNDDHQLARNAVINQLEAALRAQGYEIDFAVGQSQFRCDLAIRREGDVCYRLGILVDTADYYQQTDLLERDLMKPNLLRAFGWRIAIVLSKDWWENSANVLARLQRIAEATEDDLAQQQAHETTPEDASAETAGGLSTDLDAGDDVEENAIDR